MRYSEASTEAATFHLVREWKDCGIVARFTVDGEPVSKARARFTGYGSKTRAYTPAKTLAAEERMAEAFREAAPEHAIDPSRTYGVTALFFHGTRQRRDVDNMLKLILDGLNTVAWVDDMQVVEVSGRKCIEIPDHARTEVLVYEVGNVQHLTVGCKHCGTHFQVYPGTRRQYCTKECVYAARKLKDRPSCKVCGESVKDRRSTFCSHACLGISRRKPTPRCAQCGAGVSGTKVMLCRSCYQSRDRLGTPLRSAECEQLRHADCPTTECLCACHDDIEDAP